MTDHILNPYAFMALWGITAASMFAHGYAYGFTNMQVQGITWWTTLGLLLILFVLETADYLYVRVLNA